MLLQWLENYRKLKTRQPNHWPLGLMWLNPKQKNWFLNETWFHGAIKSWNVKGSKFIQK